MKAPTQAIAVATVAANAPSPQNQNQDYQKNAFQARQLMDYIVKENFKREEKARLYSEQKVGSPKKQFAWVA